VERKRPGGLRTERGAEFGGFAFWAAGGVEMGGVTTGEVKSYQRDEREKGAKQNGSFDTKLPSYFLIFVKVINYDP